MNENFEIKNNTLIKIRQNNENSNIHKNDRC